MPKYSRLDILSGGKGHPNTHKLVSIEEIEKYYLVTVNIGNGTQGLLSVKKDLTNDIKSYLSEMVDMPLLDPAPVGFMVNFTTRDGVNHSGTCTGVNSTEYKVLCLDGVMRYPEQVKIKSL